MKVDFNKIMMGIVMIIVFFGLLLLLGCEPKHTGNTGKDGYYFEQAEKVITDPVIHVVYVSSPAEMRQLYYDKTGKNLPNNLQLKAFSTIYPAAPDRCTLYMLDPRTTTYEPEFIGHEFAHCVFGQWHPRQDERRGQS